MAEQQVGSRSIMYQDMASQRSLIRRRNSLCYRYILTLVYAIAAAVTHNGYPSCREAARATVFSATPAEAVGPAADAIPFNKEAYQSFSLVIPTENEQDLAQFFSFSNPFRPLFRVILVPAKLVYREGIIIPNLDIRTIIYPFHSFH